MAEAHKAALARSRGGGVLCPPMIAEFLLRNVAIWQPTDFSESASSPEDVEDDMKVWMAVLEECLDKDGARPDITKPMLLQFRKYIRMAADPFKVGASMDASKDEDGPKSGTGEGETESGESKPARGASVNGQAAFGATQLPSPTLEEDLREQKASSKGQLVFGSLALFLGRAPTRAECRGVEYCSHPGSSDLIRKSAKMVGANTFVDAVAKCRAMESIVPLETFFGRLVDSLAGCADDFTGYSATAAARVGLCFNKARETADSDLVVVEYYDTYIMQSYIGRFLPKRCDYELMMRCNKLYRSLGPPGAAGAAALVAPTAVIAASVQSEMRSVLESVQALTSQVGELVSTVQRHGSRLDTVNSRLDGLNSKVEAVADSSGLPAGSKNRWIKCNKCGELGHKAADCTK